MFLRKIQKIVFIFALLLPVVLPVGVTADHSLSDEECEAKYLVPGGSTDELLLCFEHARVDREREECEVILETELPIPREQEYLDCLAAVEPASDGYDGSPEPTPTTPPPFTPPSGDGYAITVTDSSGIYDRLNDIISFLSIGIGVVITGSVIVSGVQWAASRGDPQAAGAAVRRLTNTGIGLLLFVLGWTLINWLVPGGAL